MNLFKLAELELIREGKKVKEASVLSYAIKIRKWLDTHREATARKIMAGADFYQYRNRIVTR